MKIKSYLPLVWMLGLLLLSCDPIQSYSEIPEINFKELFFEDRTDPLGETSTSAILIFSFIDGDGDIGAKPPDERLSKIHYAWYSKLSDHTFEPYKFPNDSIIISSEIPYNSVMDKSGAQNKLLKGTIEIELVTPMNPQGIDSMRVEFYIFDRAGNQSNIEYTPVFSLVNPPVKSLTK